MSPNETLFLESTTKVMKNGKKYWILQNKISFFFFLKDVSNSSFVQFQIWDFPGQIDFFDGTFDAETIFGGCAALVFVIDAQDDYGEALNKLYTTVTKAHKVNPSITYEVFIHKADGLSDDAKIGKKKNIKFFIFYF